MEVCMLSQELEGSSVNPPVIFSAFSFLFCHNFLYSYCDPAVIRKKERSQSWSVWQQFLASSGTCIYIFISLFFPPPPEKSKNLFYQSLYPVLLHNLFLLISAMTWLQLSLFGFGTHFLRYCCMEQQGSLGWAAWWPWILEINGPFSIVLADFYIFLFTFQFPLSDPIVSVSSLLILLWQLSCLFFQDHVA